MATSYFGRNLDSLRDVIDFNELSALLGVSAKLLGYILNKKPLRNQYTKFEIKKKNGGNRVIHAPTKNLKLLQRAISGNLSKLRNFKPCVNGFVSGRDIRRNAEAHVGRRFVLNIDLEDFFGTINFGRVYGMLSSEPYSLPSSIAAAIAKASTFENKLPQGAPTSPVVSNLICTKLDAQLSRL